MYMCAYHHHPNPPFRRRIRLNNKLDRLLLDPLPPLLLLFPRLKNEG
jgi:hypothetical protein